MGHLCDIEECVAPAVKGLRVCEEHRSCAEEMCIVEGCLRAAESRHSMCPLHRRRYQRGMKVELLSSPVKVRMCDAYENPWDRLTYSALRYADADSEDDNDFRLAQGELERASIAYVESLEYRNPKSGKRMKLCAKQMTLFDSAIAA
jgi:hypothetical protein